jgi:Tfp pilus assembly protein PilF
MLGVASMNAGALDVAEENLARALKANDNADHYHYAMALCKGLRGDLEGCQQHLGRAIEIEPANRITARNDPDFQSLSRQSPIKELLHAEKAG